MPVTYSFQINFSKYTVTNGCLEVVNAIRVSGICVFAKNKKYGGLYRSKYVKGVRGAFHFGAGSHSQPWLMPIKEVTIFIEGFPKPPELGLDEMEKKYVKCLSISNIQTLTTCQ